MSGECNHTSIYGISTGTDTITSQVNITDALASHFTSVFSYENYDPLFKVSKDNAEALPLNFTSCLTEPYNTEFKQSKAVLLHAMEAHGGRGGIAPTHK
jgi:hypothetical protein